MEVITYGEHFIKRQLKFLLLTLLQLIVFVIFGQGESFYNYASLNSTTISAQLLDKKIILESVNNNSGMNSHTLENNWYYFDFHQEIKLELIKFDFWESTRLKDCKLEYQLITKDTIIEIIIDQFSPEFKLDINSNILGIKRKDIYPRCVAYINKIGIISKTRPLNQESGSPAIMLNRNKRLRIKYFLESLNEKEINEQIKIRKARKKFYLKHIERQLRPEEKSFFDNEMFDKTGSSWFCYKVPNYTNNLSNEDLKILFDKCDCDIRELYFERKMKPTEKMESKTFNFLGNQLSYKSDKTEKILVKYLNGGDAWAGHAIPHICLMGREEYINKIDSLQNDPNIFTQLQVIKGLVYFNKHKKSLEIAKKMYEKEIQSIVNDSISISGSYVYRALKVMNEYYPNEVLPLLLDLYKKYRSLYPKEIKISNPLSDGYSWSTLSNKRVNSFQSCDESILSYIEAYITRYPHLSNNAILKEFEYYIKQQTVRNIGYKNYELLDE